MELNFYFVKLLILISVLYVLVNMVFGLFFKIEMVDKSITKDQFRSRCETRIPFSNGKKLS